MLGLTDLNMRKRQNREADSQTEDNRKNEGKVRLTSDTEKGDNQTRGKTI
jgi:hypothetical protein